MQSRDLLICAAMVLIVAICLTAVTLVKTDEEHFGMKPIFLAKK